MNTAFRRFGTIPIVHSGTATISGVIREEAIPVSRPVFLLEQEGFRVIRETRSAEDGTYSFPNIEGTKQYMVLTVDPSGSRCAVISDRISP